MMDPAGGFLAELDFDGKPVPGAAKGLILNARILWTFSAAARITREFPDGATRSEGYLKTAARAEEYILKHFMDHEYGGAWWSLNPDGSPLDTKKQFYAIAFAIYGLSEYYRASGRQEALVSAVELFKSIDGHSRDKQNGGYIEACSGDWSSLADMRLSDKDRNDAKTMNTHLHILEAYTSLYRIWKDEVLGRRLKELIRIFLDRIVSGDSHLGLFFDEDWNPQCKVQSFGHDIEASWLLQEAAQILGEPELMPEVSSACMKIASASLEGYVPGKGMTYEWDRESGRRDADRHWWVQAETVVGCFNAWQMSGDRQWLDRCLEEWEFIKEHIICPDGEWYWSVKGGTLEPDRSQCRAGFWKCPYHNGRMCMELIERIKTIR